MQYWRKACLKKIEVILLRNTKLQALTWCFQVWLEEKTLLHLLTLPLFTPIWGIWSTSYLNLKRFWQIELYPNIAFILDLFLFLALEDKLFVLILDEILNSMFLCGSMQVKYYRQEINNSDWLLKGGVLLVTRECIGSYWKLYC